MFTRALSLSTVDKNASASQNSGVEPTVYTSRQCIQPKIIPTDAKGLDQSVPGVAVAIDQPGPDQRSCSVEMDDL